MYWMILVVLLGLGLHGLLMGQALGGLVQVLFAVAIIWLVFRRLVGPSVVVVPRPGRKPADR
ncbi:MAG TPA: hypothetical protein VFI79_04705 [Gemmatimonadales bacterium]|nr:hypothetical protein [Gemmatimonadales bacterium]